jgi:hypothetical protein
MSVNAIWPSLLPQNILVEGYVETPPQILVRTAMDVGPAKVRPRYTQGIRTIKGSVAMTRDQVEILRAFVDTTLDGGTLAFEWTHPRTDAVVNLRFVEIPTAEAVLPDGLWLTRLSLEVVP